MLFLKHLKYVFRELGSWVMRLKQAQNSSYRCGAIRALPQVAMSPIGRHLAPSVRPSARAVALGLTHVRFVYMAFAVALLMALGREMAPSEQITALVYGNAVDAWPLLVYLLAGAAFAGLVAGLAEGLTLRSVAVAVAECVAVSLLLHGEAITSGAEGALRLMFSVARHSLPPALGAAASTDRAHPLTPHRPVLQRWAHNLNPPLIYEAHS